MSEKQILQRAAHFKESTLEKRNFLLQRQEVIRFIELTIRFVLALLLSRSKILSNLSPFGIGFLAAAGAGTEGLVTLFGTIIGYLSAGPLSWSIQYVATALLVFAASFVFRGTNLTKKSWWCASLAGFMTACTGFVYAADGGWTFSAVAIYLIQVVIAGGTGFFYLVALSPWPSGITDRNRELCHAVSTLMLLATLLISLSGLVIFSSISVGRVLSVLAAFIIAYKGGIGTGTAGGLALGIAMDAAAGGTPCFSMIYGFCGLISGIFSKQGKLLFAISFILANAVSALCVWNFLNGISVFLEVFIASVIFMVLPKNFLAKVGIFFPSHAAGYGILKAREYTRERIAQIASAFRCLFETVHTASGEEYNDNNIATVFDRAADSVCRSCSMSYKCWQRDYESTFNVMNDLTPKLTRHGYINCDDFPAFFSDNCKELLNLTNAINSEYRALLTRRQYKTRLLEKQGAAYNQYSDISVVLQELADDIGKDIGFDPILERKLQKYLRGLDIDASAAVFRDRGGRLHAEIDSGGLYLLKKDPAYLNKLSSVMETRLCASEEKGSPGKLKLLEAEPLAVTVGIATVKKQGQEISGDKGTYFKTDEGIFYLLLSDGMGTGNGAAKCSDSTIRILERFIRAGVAPEIILRMMNDLMLLKNDADTGCATIDLMCINLFSGETKIFKFGAAPSYIRRGDIIKKVKSKNFVPGFGSFCGTAPDLIRIKLSPGAFAVVATDGVTGGIDDTWLRETFSAYEGTSPKELTQKLMEKATEKFGNEDDMTIIAIRVDERV